MRLNGHVANPAHIVLLGALAAWVVYAVRRFGIVPKHEHLRDRRDVAYAAPWNFLDERKWTPEGIALHRRLLRFWAKSLVTGCVLWLIFDAVW